MVGLISLIARRQLLRIASRKHGNGDMSDADEKNERDTETRLRRVIGRSTIGVGQAWRKSGAGQWKCAPIFFRRSDRGRQKRGAGDQSEQGSHVYDWQKGWEGDACPSGVGGRFLSH
ncbi:hypothetical protein XAC3275 [Xanthomonas citri pv. citri str. 306]|uniref:Uncharacterized protein n=1 Tax=Xanthomonas axonopodis pv. citri (strain 306) TaxID=190486 RepID=A0AAI7ZHD9_XANAC|nr:hypothetical protein XAC3275 [Xanthomonas citri pv. citri str. 306]